MCLGEVPDLHLLGNTHAAQFRAVGPRALCCGRSEVLSEVLRVVQTVFQGDGRICYIENPHSLLTQQSHFVAFAE